MGKKQANLCRYFKILQAHGAIGSLNHLFIDEIKNRGLPLALTMQASWLLTCIQTTVPISDYYELCRTHHGILSQFLRPEAQIEPIEKREPLKSNGKSSRYLFEFELRMLLGVFSTCWAKNYKRSEGWI